MPIHYWGEEGFDWEGLNDAAEYIASFCKRWARLGGQYKEKWGEVRFYAQFCGPRYLSLHMLTHPGHAFYRYPKWLVWVDIYILTKVLGFLFGKIMHRWQKYIYGKAYLNACKRWPHLQAEILSAADWPEWIPGRVRHEGNLKHILDLEGNVVSTWKTTSLVEEREE